MSAGDNETLYQIEELKNRVLNVSSSVSPYLTAFIENYAFSFLEQCISIACAIYFRLTPSNLVIFCLEYVPKGFYLYTILHHVFAKSRELLKQKQMECEDIQLQIQIVNTKMCVGAQFNEREELMRRESGRLRRVRARVRAAIADDEELRRAMHAAPVGDADLDTQMHATPQEDDEFVTELLKSLKCENYAIPEINFDKLDCGEPAETESAAEQCSLYSSLSDIDRDIDVRQDCTVKIVRVTNMYKVAYLRHYIKQKKLRRASKRAALTKKMENIKKLLEDWQKTLSMIINTKLNILNIDTYPMDVASQEATGDYSKPREASDSDSDLRNNDMFYDEYSLSWMQNPYRPYSCEEYQDSGVPRDFLQDIAQCQRPDKPPEMTSILEETVSQVAIEDVTGDANDCRDLVAI